jgi:hypothetical protein
MMTIHHLLGGIFMPEMTADDIQREASDAFDAWANANYDDVGELGLLEQIDIYAAAFSRNEL